MSGDKGISAFPESDNLFKWVGTIDGAQGTVRAHTHTHTLLMISTPFVTADWSHCRSKSQSRYAVGGTLSPLYPLTCLSVFHLSVSQVYDGLRYRLSLDFPAGYPYQAPRVKFVTPCFHPNVDEQGFICLDILKDKWSALYDVRSILLSIQSLLGGNYDNQLTLTGSVCHQLLSRGK